MLIVVSVQVDIKLPETKAETIHQANLAAL